VHVRAAYQVRNDRNPFLRLRLPDGWHAVGVRVAGRTAEPVQAADGRWLVPLEKSVETLDGLVAFPVELMLVGDEPAWERRGLRALETPAVDAPIAYARWEVCLPRAVQQRGIEGRATLVDAWTPRDQGLLIGRATGTTLDADDDEVVLDRGRDRGGRFARKAPPAEAEGKKAEARKAKEKAADKAVSQEYWNRAYSAYKDNRFDEAEALLEQSLAFDASNASAQSLRDNVSVLQGDAELDEDQQAAANRVRELARARTNDVELAQAGKAEEAERKLRAGDLSGAKAAYEELVQLTEQLAAVEQAEAVDQKSRLDAYRQQVEALGAAVLDNASLAGATKNESLVVSSRSVGSKGAPAKKKAASTGKRDRAPARETAPASAERRQEVEFDFEDISIEGELVKPQGALLLDRKTNAPAPAPAPPPPPEPKPMPEPEPAPSLLDKDLLERVPAGRSYQAAVGVVAGAVSKPGAVTIVVPESVEEEAALDEALGGFAFGLSGEGAGGGGVAFDGAAPASGAAQSPPPATAAPAEGMDWYDEEPIAASEDAPMDDGDLRAPPRQSARVEADEIQRASLSIASVERRRWPVRDLTRAIELGARGKASRDPDLPPPPAEAFPSADPAPPALPVARGPRPVRAHPTAAAAPPAFPQVPGSAVSPAPTSPGALGPRFPRTPAAAAAWPTRPPPPPPAPFGLDVPDGITASTLSLSLPETGTGLLLEQRLLPPDEPLRLTLKYRNDRR
jgi:tetratricopeptide (TPR) repeat protein